MAMICMDADFIINFLKGDKNVESFLEKTTEKFATTSVVVDEVLFGIKMRKNGHQEEMVKTLLAGIEVIPFNAICALRSVDQRVKLAKKGIVIPPADSLIAASANHAGCTGIVTRNKRHFQHLGIPVLSY